MRGYERQGKLSVSLNCVLLKDNLSQAPALLDWASEAGFGVSFVVGEQRSRFQNVDTTDIWVTTEQRNELLSFRERRVHPRWKSFRPQVSRPQRRAFGQATFRSLLLCAGGFPAGCDGTLYYCSHSRAIGSCRKRSPLGDLLRPSQPPVPRRGSEGPRLCAECPPYTSTRLELEADIFKVLRYLAVSRISRLTRAKRPPKTTAS